MVTNFEQHTKDLTPADIPFLEVLIRGFKTKTPDNPIKEKEIIQKINSQLDELGLKRKLTGARLRKIVNHIRVNSMLPLIATSRGYYCSTDRIEIEKQILSMHERANSIINAAKGLQKMVS